MDSVIDRKSSNLKRPHATYGVEIIRSDDKKVSHIYIEQLEDMVFAAKKDVEDLARTTRLFIGKEFSRLNHWKRRKDSQLSQLSLCRKEGRAGEIAC